MKNKIKSLLQNLLGFKTYLFFFSKFKIATLKWDGNENHFFHFVDLLPNSGLILDIGSNIGIMTSRLANAKPQSMIYSFEPIKENFDVLSEIVTSNQHKNVKLYNIALGAEAGNLTMIMPMIGNAKQQGLSHVFNPDEHYEYGGEKYTVPVEKLDDVLSNETLQIKGIKIDVENFEYQVLLGAQAILKKQKPLLYVELWDNKNRTDCFDLMHNIGYKTMVLVNNKLTEFTNQVTQNFFFVCEKSD